MREGSDQARVSKAREGVEALSLTICREILKIKKGWSYNTRCSSLKQTRDCRYINDHSEMLPSS